MTAHAIAVVLYPFFAVFLLHLAAAVFVTTIAGVTVQPVGVAIRAGASATFAVVQRESVCQVVLGRCPGAGGMTNMTV